jgi:hypothetical protein
MVMSNPILNPTASDNFVDAAFHEVDAALDHLCATLGFKQVA